MNRERILSTWRSTSTGLEKRAKNRPAVAMEALISTLFSSLETPGAAQAAPLGGVSLRPIRHSAVDSNSRAAYLNMDATGLDFGTTLERCLKAGPDRSGDYSLLRLYLYLFDHAFNPNQLGYGPLGVVSLKWPLHRTAQSHPTLTGFRLNGVFRNRRISERTSTAAWAISSSVRSCPGSNTSSSLTRASTP